MNGILDPVFRIRERARVADRFVRAYVMPA